MFNLKIFNKKEKLSYVKYSSNVIQYDDMGYPLRLVINNEGRQEWLDTYEREGDVVLRWNDNSFNI